MNYVINKFIRFAFIILISSNSFGQKTKFAQLCEKMYFNVFERNPDKQIRPFIKKYYPAFLGFNKSENAGWATNLKKRDIPYLDTTIHSFLFTSHPIIKAKFNSGQFDLYNYERKDSLPLVANWSLLFRFDNLDEANICFDSIYKIFETLSKDKISFKKDNRRIAQLTNEKELSDLNCVELVLVPDDIIDNNYKIYFTNGRRFQKN